MQYQLVFLTALQAMAMAMFAVRCFLRFHFRLTFLPSVFSHFDYLDISL